MRKVYRPLALLLSISTPLSAQELPTKDLPSVPPSTSHILGKYCELRLIHKAQPNRTILMNGNHLFTNLLNI